MITTRAPDGAKKKSLGQEVDIGKGEYCRDNFDSETSIAIKDRKHLRMGIGTLCTSYQVEIKSKEKAGFRFYTIYA